MVTEKDKPRGGTTRRIYGALKAQILAGTYGPKDRLPSTRALAAELGVSRTTVTAAYEQLLSEGFLESRQGAPSRVALLHDQQTVKPLAEGTPSGAVSLPATPVRLSRFGATLAEGPVWAPPQSDALIADFRYGDLSAPDFPAQAWRRSVNAALRRRQPRLAYDDPGGSAHLRTALQAYLWRARGLRCEPQQIVIVNGSQQGLDLAARVLVDPGDRVAVEDPGYVMARRVFAAAGAEVVPIAVDEEGLRTEALAGLDAVRLAYVTPSHQFPLGSVLSARRRQELLSWSGRTGAYVIEDDYDGEYRYDIRPIPPLQTMAHAENVLYLGTISKSLSPMLRLGYLVVPPPLYPAFAAAKQLVDRHSPSLDQEALAEMIASGAYERHIRRNRRSNGRRRTALLAALKAELGDQVTITGADAGLHVVVWFDRLEKAEEGALIARARAAGIGLYQVSPLYADCEAGHRPDRAGVLMGYASLDVSKIGKGVAALARVLRG
ncbi:PLP-dependent aminotransferase family protein [Ensifer adhaerens]|uniref:MocR-like pyridoxine biosynthesis transcription factor PdxR n=1 Tax=Ensifer adhaerens TaxID=106592 RepID=UPI001CBB6A93|nr:PLP-dependent aminotransferase family protein [Ensifer adhaerens]MBZ7922316.1 PLP-dependent aminotransferase family protein [Ensifer adhaerens]